METLTKKADQAAKVARLNETLFGTSRVVNPYDELLARIDLELVRVQSMQPTAKETK